MTKKAAATASRKITANKLGALTVAVSDAVADGFAGLSASAAAAVLTLRHTPSLGTTELAHVVGLSQPACTRMVDKLVAEGLAERLPAAGRVVPVALTDHGRRLGELVQARRLSVLRDAAGALDKKERKDLDRLLDKLLAALVDGPEAGRRACRLCDHPLCPPGSCPGRPPAPAAPPAE